MTDKNTIDTAGQLEAVDRGLSVTDTADGAYVVATISQTYATTVEDLWHACTTPQRLARWFGPVTGDLKLGGRYQIEGNANGTIEQCQPPTSLRLTWEFADNVSWVSVQIDPTDDNGARLTLEHSADTPQDFWETYGPGATGVGWELAFLGLANYLADPDSNPVESTGEWEQTNDAREFITGSSTAWADTWIAAGEPEDSARGAEQRTTAFFTGQET